MAAALAPAVEAAGFASLWVNDTPGADALAVLDAAAAVTTTLTLATGVIPVDRRSAASIARDVRARDLPADRLVLGIGAGQTREGALRLVGNAASALRDQLAARVVVGALGPKMRHLAAAEADGPLLSWLTPEIARTQASEAHAIAAGTHLTLYIRAALDPGATARLHEETARYASYPAYRRTSPGSGSTPHRPCCPRDPTSPRGSRTIAPGPMRSCCGPSLRPGRSRITCASSRKPGSSAEPWL